jgi:hypothetical protein
METNSAGTAKELIGICGIYCGTCPRYLAPRDNDIAYLKKASQESGLPMEAIRCDGCLSNNVFPACRDCRHGFRRCAGEKKVTWCFQCPDLPCSRLLGFLPIHVVNGISHHARLIQELEYMKEQGIKKWLEKQDRSGRCPHCGKMLYWYARECPACQFQLEQRSGESDGG